MTLGPIAAVIAVAEIIAFVSVAHATSWGLAILLTLVTSAVGVALASRTARRAVHDARAGAAGGSGALADSAVALAGCFLLVLPGFVTDALGMLMVLRPTRVVIRRLVGARLAARFERSRVVTVWPAGRPTRPGPPGRPGRRTDGHQVIEGEVVDPRPPGPDSTTPRRPD